MNRIWAFYPQYSQVIALQTDYISQVMTLLNTCNSQVLALLLPCQSQSITLLYGQEITSTATAKQQNAGLCFTQAGSHSTHRLDKSHPHRHWHVYAAIGQQVECFQARYHGH